MKRMLPILSLLASLAVLGLVKLFKLAAKPFSFLRPAHWPQSFIGFKLAQHMRLRHIILLCVVVSLLITECLVISFSYVMWNRDQFGRLDRETLLMLKANVDSTSFLSVNETLKMGERIIGFSAVRGGAIYNRLGQEIASFGNHPALSMLTYEREAMRHYISNDQVFLDIYYPVELTGLANPMVLRIDAKRVPEILKEHLKEKFLTTLAISFLASLAIVFLLSLTIIKPVLKLRNSVLMATDNPNTADRARLNWKRGDEFGDVARALDLLFTSVSIVYQEDLAAGQEATQQSAFAVLTYDSGARLINVNTAALRLFGAETHDDMIGVHEFFVRQISDEGTKDVSPLSLVLDEPPIKIVNIVTRNGLKRCLMHGIVVHKRNGTTLRTIITLVDITKSAKEKEELKNEAVEAQQKNTDLTRRMTEMRNLFQSCMILLSATENKKDGAETDVDQNSEQKPSGPVVMTDRIATAWYNEARRGYLIDSELEHGVLPPVYGRPEEVEAVFRQAFMTVYAQARVEKPLMHIKAEPAGDKKHAFEIFEQMKPNAQLRRVDETLLAGARLSLASLKHSLENLNGTLDEVEPGRVRFTLHSASFNDVDMSVLHRPGLVQGKKTAS